MIIIAKCLRCGHKLVLNLGEGGLEAEVCSICGAPGSQLEIYENLEETMPDRQFIAEMIGKVA